MNRNTIQFSCLSFCNVLLWSNFADWKTHLDLCKVRLFTPDQMRTVWEVGLTERGKLTGMTRGMPGPLTIQMRWRRTKEWNVDLQQGVIIPNTQKLPGHGTPKVSHKKSSWYRNKREGEHHEDHYAWMWWIQWAVEKNESLQLRGWQII